MLGEQALDYTKHCLYSFGTYCMGPHEANPYNTVATRALDCLYIGPTNHVHGGHILYHIQSGRVITRHGNITAHPMPTTVVEVINKRAKRHFYSLYNINLLLRNLSSIYLNVRFWLR